MSSKQFRGRKCAVVGCHNNQGKLRRWRENICEEHSPLQHKECPCLEPFGFRYFPSDVNKKMAWISALKRMDFIPNRDSVVLDMPSTTADLRPPTLPFSSFYLFCLDEKPKIIEAFPVPPSESAVMKELGSRYLTCPRLTLAKYDALAKADFKRYEKELKKYDKLVCMKNKLLTKDCTSANVQSSQKKCNFGKSSRASEKPRWMQTSSESVIPSPLEPLSPFFWFCLERKVSEGEHSSTLIELASAFSQEWQRTLPAERSKFEQLAKIDKSRYEKELIIYNQKQTANMSVERDENLGSEESNGEDLYNGVEDLLEIKLEYASDKDD